MYADKISSYPKIINKLSNIYNNEQCNEFLKQNNIGILILTEFRRSNGWPVKNKSYKFDGSTIIPILWGFFYSDGEEILFDYAIHPTKCFPTIYNKKNQNGIRKKVHIEYHPDGYVIAGCQIYQIENNGIQYRVSDLTPEYCKTFGLPSECYENDFYKELIFYLQNKSKYNIWSYEENKFFNDYIPKLKINFIKDKILPKTYYYYIDNSWNYLRGIYSNRDLKTLNNTLSYRDGRELIEDMNRNNPLSYRYEEKATYYIKKSLIHEFIRQYLLILNKEKLNKYKINETKKFNQIKINSVKQKIERKINNIEENNKRNILRILNGLRSNIDNNKLNRDRFSVIDVEYIPIAFPTELAREGYFNFPSVFSNIIWKGRENGIEMKIHVINIPCHVCMKNCDLFKKNTLKFDCIKYLYPIIEDQISLIEYLIDSYENFRIYSYGKSDVCQLEQGDNFFRDSFDARIYNRKNRHRKKKITEISFDLSKTGFSLHDIEKNILSEWIKSWKRDQQKVKVNPRIMTKNDSPYWNIKYEEAINACVQDSFSAFLFLLYEKYRINDEVIHHETKSLDDYS